jgi:chemotaxis protein methyltransferase CheR
MGIWMDLQHILDYLHEQRRLDFSRHCRAMVDRRLETRMQAVRCDTEAAYLGYLKQHAQELDCLVDALAINVSSFFRNPLAFEYLAQEVLPTIITEKQRRGGLCLRVWSAGCANGEEPYSVAILMDSLLKKEDSRFQVNIFATDVNKGAIQRALLAEYTRESLKDIKLGLFQEYFTEHNHTYRISGAVTEQVQFSQYDLLSPLGHAPSESVFAGLVSPGGAGTAVYRKSDNICTGCDNDQRGYLC